MKYVIKFRPAVEKDIRHLPQKELIRIKRKIESLAENLPDRSTTKMKGNNNFHKIRVGNYKIIYSESQISETECPEICKSNYPASSGGYNTRDEIHDDVLVILVVKIGNRKDIYKKLPQPT